MFQAISNFLSQFKLARLMLMLAVIIITTMLLSAYLSTRSVREGVIQVEHDSISSHVVALSKAVKNIQTSNAAERIAQAREIIYPARWNHDDSGYAFLLDGKTANYLLYPPNPNKEGEALSHIELIEGGTLAQAIKRSSERGVAEMVHYNHVKPGATKPTMKAAYLLPLSPGGDVLVAGDYLDKSERIIDDIYDEILTPMVLVIIFVLIFVAIITRHLNQRANYLKAAMQRLAEGDLRYPVRLAGKDELALLADALNNSQQNLSSVLKMQTDNGANIASASMQIDSSLGHTNELIHSELDSLNQLASAMEEMVCSVAEVAENASNASSNAQCTDQRTHQGEQQILESVQAIEALCEKLKTCAESVNEVRQGVTNIDSVVETIHGISEQTNMLALNAAIEAARAGEQGRGFAVVADEVRQLASRTQEATQEITETIERLNSQANSAVELVELSVTTANEGMASAKLAGNEFVAITENITQLTENNLQIATAAEQQRNVAETMSENINQLNTELAETSDDLNELASASNSLKAQTDLLDKQLQAFHFEHENQQINQPKPFDEKAVGMRGASI